MLLDKAQLLGLTASPERRTGDQKDQLGLAFDAIIDRADIEELIEEKVLVPADYFSFFFGIIMNWLISAIDRSARQSGD